MKIAHFITSIDLSTGGPARSVTHLIKKITSNSKIEISLITKKSSNPIISSFNNQSPVLFFNRRQDLKIILNSLIKNKVEIFHGHGIWQYTVHKMAVFSRKNNIPYIITPRGMLEPWSLTQKKYRKKIAMLLYQKKDLEKATVIHVTAKSEKIQIRNLGFKNPIAVIPNGVNLDKFPSSYPTKSISPKKILFLSRLHKKKGIENLIEAWKLIDIKIKESWLIEIVGNGEEKYIISLKESIIKENLNEQIVIRDPVYGIEKINLFREANLFVLPTYSENFGVVIAEALASFTPVITTKGTPWEDLETYKCGWWIEIGTTALRKTLEEALLKDSDELKVMSLNGRKLIENKYSMDSVSRDMIHLYDWMQNKENKPNFVNIYKNL